MQIRSCLLAALGTLSLLPAQTIATTFATGSLGHTSSLAVRPSVSLDMQVLHPAGIVIQQLDVLFGLTGRPGTLDIYFTDNGGTYSGTLVNPGPGTWLRRSTGSYTSLGTGTPTPVALDKPIVLPAGSYGVTLVFHNQIPRFYSISTNPPTQTVFSNADVVLTTGARQNEAFVTTASARVPSLQFGYAPATVDAVDFTADVDSGTAPLTVQFTDRSIISSGPILGWEWDFDGDAVVDSTVQNPTAIYPLCGDYSPRLRVLTAGGPLDCTWTDLIRVDPLQAGFTAAPSIGAPPNLAVQFTDTSKGTPFAWLWDFDGDAVIDSTLQHPNWNFGPGSHEVTLTVINGCRSSSHADRVTAATGSFDVGIAGGTNTFATPSSMVVGDLTVLANEPLALVGLDVNAYAPNGVLFTAEVYLTNDTWVGKHLQPEAWRLAAFGTGICRGANTASPLRLDRPLLLMPGASYGVAVHYPDSHSYYISPGSPVLSNADLAFTSGAAIGTANGVFVNSNLNQPRQLSAIFYYIRQSQFAIGTLNWFGNGCAGSLPATRLWPGYGERLLLGTTTNVWVDNLPLNAGFVTIGFSHTSSVFGPLPIDLGVLGMPGCKGYVSPDATSFLLGANQQAAFALSLPNYAGIAGILLHMQVLVIDPGVNQFGAVISDAAAGLTGSW
jgi:PKD repeat protein